MVTIKAKGHELESVIIRDSFNRRAVQFRNVLIQTLRKIGLTEDDIDITLEPNAAKRAPASIGWFVDGKYLYYRYAGLQKFVENLWVVQKVIDLEVQLILRGEKSLPEFIVEFSEEKNVEERRVNARELLEIDEGEQDLEMINKKYKILARKHHPDMPEGDGERFKAINRAHKLLKKDLE